MIPRKASKNRVALAAGLSLIPFLLLCIPFHLFAVDKKVLFLPLVFHADESKAYLRSGIKTMFVSRLSGEGLAVLTDEAYGPLLSEEEKRGIASEKRAEELARKLNAGYAIFGSVTSLGAGYSIDLSVMDLSKEEVRVKKVSEAVPEDQLITKLSDVAYDLRAVIAGVDIRQPVAPRVEDTGKGLFFKASSEGASFRPTGRFSIRAAVMSLDQGDLDGDGQPELVVLSREAVTVYKRKEQKFEQKDVLRGARGEEFLRVSVADMDKNGKAEIYLVSFYGSRAQTYIYEWTGRFNKLSQQNGHLNVVRDPAGGKDLLVFQDSNLTNFFDGGMRVVNLEPGAKLSKGDALPLPRGTQLYTLMLYDLDRDGRLEFLGLGNPGLDELAWIHVWDTQGKELWHSEETVGATNNAIRFGKAAVGDLAPRVSFNSRLVAVDVDNDGKREILAITNIPMIGHLDFKLYEKGNLTAFKVQGITLSQFYKSRNMDYCLTDMQTQGHSLFLSAHKGELSNLSEETGRIMWFE
jgi:hypothetical protein